MPPLSAAPADTFFALFFPLKKVSGRGYAALSAVPADTFFALFFLLLKVSGRGYAALSAVPADTFFTYKIAAKRRFAGGQRNKNAKNSDELSPVRKKDYF